MDKNESEFSSAVKKESSQPLLTSIALTFLLLIGNGVLLLSSIPDTPLIQLCNYLWVAVILFFWIQWKYPEHHFQTIRQFFNGLSLKEVLIATGSGIGLFILGAIGYALSQLIGFSQPEVTNSISGSKDVIPLITYAVTTIIFAPVLEEIAFRGLIVRKLKTGFSTLSIYMISALLFSVYHLSAFQLASTFLIGIGLAFLAIKTKNLWAPNKIAHGIYNGIGFLLFIFTNAPS